MAGAILDRQLTPARTSRVRFAIATRADDASIRRLLRENPMPGQISISLEREPDYFADADLPGEEKQTIVAYEGERAVCVGSCTIRERFVNGRPRRVGYLGSLRLDADQAGRFDIVRRGYEVFRELQLDAPADFYFTSIAVDNERARKFLEHGVPGMPHYELIGEFVTLLIPTVHSLPRKEADAPDRTTPPLPHVASYETVEELVECVNGYNNQFAPCWSADELRALCFLGLRAEDFCIVSENGRIAACAALWDQRDFKQTVIRGYAPWLSRTRRVLNFIRRLAGGMRLPAVGATLANAFVSHLAVAPGEPEKLITLVAELRRTAARRGIEGLTLGFAADDPHLAILRHTFRCREYRSRVYVVHWPDLGGAAGGLDGRLLAPEVALL